MNVQYHKHPHTCYKKYKKGSKVIKERRFGYNKPPMKATKILLPLEEKDNEHIKTHKDNYKSIKSFINKVTKKDEDMTFEQVLEKLELTEDEYILALRSSLKGPKVFLRRNLNERNHKFLQ